jgi:hypothetical protein
MLKWMKDLTRQKTGEMPRGHKTTGAEGTNESIQDAKNTIIKHRIQKKKKEKRGRGTKMSGECHWRKNQNQNSKFRRKANM